VIHVLSTIIRTNVLNVNAKLLHTTVFLAVSFKLKFIGSNNIYEID